VIGQLSLPFRFALHCGAMKSIELRGPSGRLDLGQDAATIASAKQHHG
jgi:hypothetical protein